MIAQVADAQRRGPCSARGNGRQRHRRLAGWDRHRVRGGEHRQIGRFNLDGDRVGGGVVRRTSGGQHKIVDRHRIIIGIHSNSHRSAIRHRDGVDAAGLVAVDLRSINRNGYRVAVFIGEIRFIRQRSAGRESFFHLRVVKVGLDRLAGTCP